MKSIKMSSFSMGFRLFLNLCGFVSAGLICFLAGAFLCRNDYILPIISLERQEIIVIIAGLFIVLVLVSLLFLFLRFSTSAAFKGGRLPFIFDASGSNYFITEMMGNINIGIFVSDLKTGKPLFINRKMKDLFDLCPDAEKIGWNGDIKKPPQFLNLASPEKKGELLPEGTCAWDGISALNKRWYSVRVSKMQWFDGRIAAFQTVYDINSLKKRESELRDFTRGILRDRETELKIISTNLHDHVAQDLASLRIALDTVYYGIDDIPEKLTERTRNMSIVLQDAISHLREIAYGLTPSSLDDFGIEKALHQYCSEFSEKSGVRISCICSGIHNISSGCELSINIYRIIQNTVANLASKTSPAHIRVSVVFSATRIIVKFESDGKGYEVNTSSGYKLAEEELELHNVRERIRLLRGEGLRINSGNNMGILISFEIHGDFSMACNTESQALNSGSLKDDALNSVTEARPYKTCAAKKFLLFCKDEKNDSELRHPDQYQAHVQWRR
ncbi:sensor histidine kinase [Desulforegula conservatrix]|uniref:sensor histidine kinase n=1 Tax=Desulforegula conservatrix TaxID=153026 RepID=UPI000481C93C|nr:histidine kinase [Desulforegula conservatrix]